jgi:hypothetical protein
VVELLVDLMVVQDLINLIPHHYCQLSHLYFLQVELEEVRMQVVLVVMVEMAVLVVEEVVVEQVSLVEEGVEVAMV